MVHWNYEAREGVEARVVRCRCREGSRASSVGPFVARAAGVRAAGWCVL